MRFHCLPLEKQQDWEDAAASYASKGLRLIIIYLEYEGSILEVSVRIDKESDHRSVVGDPA